MRGTAVASSHRQTPVVGLYYRSGKWFHLSLHENMEGSRQSTNAGSPSLSSHPLRCYIRQALNSHHTSKSTNELPCWLIYF